jgi:CHASE3 domain sensor protein
MLLTKQQAKENLTRLVEKYQRVDLNNKQDKTLHDNLVVLVDVMLDLNKKIQSAKGSAKEQIQREITKTDGAIDQIVYQLYGITEEEKKIIEGVV